MKKITLVFLAIALLIFAQSSYGQFTKKGTVGMKFLDIGVGGRALAMGEAYTAIANDASAIFWNPAGIGNVKSSDVFAGYTKWPADINLYSIAFVKKTELPMLGSSTVGLAGTLLNTGLMNRTTEFDPDGSLSGTFAYEDYWFGMSYAKYLTDRFCFGTTVKYLHEQIADWKVNSWAVDIGSYYETGFKSIRIGLAILNFGPDLQYKVDNDKDGRIDEDPLDGVDNDGDGLVDEDDKEKAVPIPLTFRAGVAMDVFQNEMSRATLVAELAHPSDNAERYQFGGEYWFKDMIAVRAGYKLNMDEGGFTAGAGLKMPFSGASNFSIDYAYNDWGILNAVHRVSTSISF
jgi:hypothetical protein